MALCPHCMNQTAPGNTCSICGGSLAYQARAHQLPAGTVLTDGAFRSYEIGAVKGQGGFGITYIAMDLRRKMRVALKEFFPVQCAQRTGIQVTPTAGMDQIFAGGQKNFLKEAQMLAALPPMASVVQIMDYFEVNGTAYIAMEYLDGTPLFRMVQQAPIDAGQLIPRLMPLLKDLRQLHAANIVHRDISPDNIMWMPDGSLKLLDFGSARHLEDGKSVSIQLKHGFAPVEQYLTKGQGPFTDIYALCATIYYCLTGQIPPHAAQRLEEDTLVRPGKLGVRVPVEWEDALLWGLTVQPKARPQTLDDLLRRMFPIDIPEKKDVAPDPPPAPIPEPDPDPEPTVIPELEPQLPAEKKNPLKDLLARLKALSAGTKVIAAIGAAVVVLLVILIGVLAGGKNEPVYTAPPEPDPVVTEEPKEDPVAEETPEPEPEPEPAPAPDPEPLITEDGLEMELTDGEARVIAYHGDEDTVLIPDEAFGAPVTTVASGAFAGSSVAYVAISPSVGLIENGAFTNCENLAFFVCGSEDSTLYCEDEFAGCSRLLVIQTFSPDGWQGNIPDHAVQVWMGMETPVGIMEDYDYLADGSVFGWTKDGTNLLLKVEPSLTAFELPEDVGLETVYILDGAFDGCRNLDTVTLSDQVYYSMDTAEVLFELNVNCNFNSPTFAWYQACTAAANANEQLGKLQVMPNQDLCMIAHIRAAELAEDFTEDRPDGRDWTTLFEDYEFDCSYCMQQGGRSGSDEILLTSLQEHMDSFLESAYDENGDPYTDAGFGITVKDDVYYYIFYYTNNT